MNHEPDQKNSPLRAARVLRHDPGCAFLDSGRPGHPEVSRLASRPDLVLSGTDWDRLESELARRSDGSRPEGAAIGFVDFDGRFHFGFYDRVYSFRHAEASWTCAPDEFGLAGEEAACEVGFRPLLPKEDFLQMVQRAKEYIAAGDIYQVCLSHPYDARVEAGSAWDYFERLRRISPAPYAAYIDTGAVQIASASPECFLRMDGRRIVTRPIKGTRPRRPDPARDAQSADDLVSSPKEMAELIMITDLERNDLGRVCEFGSVRAPELLKLERYEQVFHLVSTVEGRLREDVSHVRALRECFPGGSISGAPKKRALEIIQELEPHPRGIYTGAIGYFGYSGESQFSIAIRTAIFRNGRAGFHVGAGIVADSIPEKEWQETLDKAAGLLAAGRAARMAAHPNF